MEGLKHNFYSLGAGLESVLAALKVPGNLVYIKSAARPLKLGTLLLFYLSRIILFNVVMISCVIKLCVVE